MPGSCPFPPPPPGPPAAFAGWMVLELGQGGGSPLAHLGLIEPGMALGQAPWWLQLVGAVLVAGGLGAFSGGGAGAWDAETY